MGVIKDYFYNTKEMTEKEYTYAKAGFIINGSALGSANNFTAGSYLAGLLAYLGASEAESNFIMSLPLFAGFLQILVPLIVSNIKFKKPYVLFCEFFDRLPMGLMFLMPFIFGVGKLSVVAVGVLCMIGYTCTYLMNSSYNEWFIDCVSHGGGAGKFCGFKDSITNGVLVVTFFVLAMITKHFTGEREVFGYMWLGICAICLWAVSIIALVFVKEPYKKEVEKEKGAGIIKTFKIIFTYKKLRLYLTFGAVYNFGLYLVNSLISIMYVQRLKMPLEILSYAMVLDLLVRTFLAPVFGRLSDKIGAKKVVFGGLFVLAVSVLLYSFMTPENAIVMRMVNAVVCAVAWSMLGAPCFMLMAESLPDTNRSACMAGLSAIFLALGYVASLITTWFIGVANGMSFNILGYTFSEMGLVFIVGSGIIFISSLIVLLSKKYN